MFEWGTVSADLRCMYSPILRINSVLQPRFLSLEGFHSQTILTAKQTLT